MGSDFKTKFFEFYFECRFFNFLSKPLKNRGITRERQGSLFWSLSLAQGHKESSPIVVRRRSSVFIVKIEHISHLVVVFLLLTLSM